MFNYKDVFMLYYKEELSGMANTELDGFSFL